MALYRTEGIVIRNRNMGEADKVVTAYTRDKGKVRSVARGARRPRSRLIGSTQIFTHADFLFFKNKSLDTLSQAEIKEPFSILRDDLEKMAFGSYVLELVDSMTESGEENVDIFALLLATLYLLQSSTSNYSLLIHSFELKFMALMGYSPQIKGCNKCGEIDCNKYYFSPSLGGLVCNNCSDDGDFLSISKATIKIMDRLFFGDLDKLHVLKVNDDFQKELDTILRKYIDYRLEKPLKTVEFLKLMKEL